MNRTMPYPCRSRSDSVRRINMSSEPGNESFFCALRPIQRILSLQEFGHANQVQRALQSLKAKPTPAKPEARPCGDAGDTAHASGSTLISTTGDNAVRASISDQLPKMVVLIPEKVPDSDPR